MVYDPARERVVLFGGTAPSSTGGLLLGDTWTWKGDDWQKESPPTSPSARYGALLTYEPRRGVVVLFGGAGRPNEFFYDTWAWDGMKWTLLSSTTPPGFDGTADAMAYDPRRHMTMFFAFPGGVLAEQSMWFFDGTTWTRQPLPLGELPLDGQAMAYDEALGQVIEFGGEDAAGAGSSRTVRSDTWAWDGRSWSRLNTGLPPSPRVQMAMAYDSDRHVIVVFGGLDGANRALGDTWTFDGSTWRSQN